MPFLFMTQFIKCTFMRWNHLLQFRAIEFDSINTKNTKHVLHSIPFKAFQETAVRVNPYQKLTIHKNILLAEYNHGLRESQRESVDGKLWVMVSLTLQAFKRVIEYFEVLKGLKWVNRAKKPKSFGQLSQ